MSELDLSDSTLADTPTWLIILSNGTKLGPYSMRQLAAIARNGKVGPDDFLQNTDGYCTHCKKARQFSFMQREFAARAELYPADWFVLCDGGPYTMEQLEAKASLGEIYPYTLIRYRSHPWHEAGEQAFLRVLFKSSLATSKRAQDIATDAAPKAPAASTVGKSGEQTTVSRNSIAGSTDERLHRKIAYAILLCYAACVVTAMFFANWSGETTRSNSIAKHTRVTSVPPMNSNYVQNGAYTNGPTTGNSGPDHSVHLTTPSFNSNWQSGTSNAKATVVFGSAKTEIASPDLTSKEHKGIGYENSSKLQAGHVDNTWTASFASPYKVPTVSSSGPYYNYTYRPPVGDHYVQGFVRRDGTYVQGHYRTNPDNSFWNNWSSKGNVNPHTGKVGTRTPTTIRHSRR